MSQKLVPLNGGIEQIQNAQNYRQGVFLSSQYVNQKGLQPSSTEWIPNGRPIYGRLPVIYRLEFDNDSEIAYVGLPTGSSRSGPGSLEVSVSGNNKYLVIQSGTVVWKEGEVPLEPVILDLELIGMKSTRYFIGYQLYADRSAFAAQYSVNDYSLAGLRMNVKSGTDSVSGWRHKPVFAFTNEGDRTWRNYDEFFPGYTGEPYLSWQTELANAYSSITLRCSPSASFSGSASLFYQVCPNPIPGQPYCASPEWVLQDTVSIDRDFVGQFFKFEISNPSFQKGWKVVWTDSKIAINNVAVSGTLTLESLPAVPLTYCQLVAYPSNAIPKEISNDEGEVIPVVMCGLAQVDINNAFEVTAISDIRQTINSEYQPVADWLTRTWDKRLTDLQGRMKNYSELWMNPETCLRGEYSELENYQIEVKF